MLRSVKGGLPSKRMKVANVASSMQSIYMVPEQNNPIFPHSIKNQFKFNGINRKRSNSFRFLVQLKCDSRKLVIFNILNTTKATINSCVLWASHTVKPHAQQFIISSHNNVVIIYTKDVPVILLTAQLT